MKELKVGINYINQGGKTQLHSCHNDANKMAEFLGMRISNEVWISPSDVEPKLQEATEAT